MRSVTISGLFAAFVTISLAGHIPSASAQDGPPPHIREAIDSVVQMLQSEGDASLDRFDRRELIESLGEMRERTDGLTDGISVEAEPDGLRLVLEGGGRREQIRLVIEEGGIVSIGLLEGEQNTSYMPPPESLSEDDMIRAHIGVIENSGFMDLNAFDTLMVEGHLEPEFVASLSSAERLALLRNIQAAASVAGGVMVNFDGDRYTVLLEGPDGEGRVTFSVQGEAPYKITSLGYAANSTGSEVPTVTVETLPQIIDDFERNGWSGLIFAQVGGEMVLSRPFGQANAELGISEGIGGTTATPPYKQFYGGGPQSVRGFKESYLGPRDSFGRPYGGNVLAAGQVELIIPLPEKFASQARASLFYDFGNVFSTGEVGFTDKLGSPMEYNVDFKELRTSVGIGVQWLAPLGLFRFSYAYPLNAYKGNDRFYGDEVERFQFSIGQAF